MSEHVDVLVIGAGLSGIGAAYRLQTTCPRLSYAILEARNAIGGTWDLFRYPGVRSDSDMFTLSYPFRPWRRPYAIGAGDTIRAYIRATAAAYGIDRRIRFGRRAESASWSSATGRWTVRTATGDEYRCTFLYLCTGYYRYSAGYEADFVDRARFAGTVVHPQQWPDDLDHTGARVAVIGSGTTAVTLVPALAGDAAHVTMVQRSPSYLISLPNHAHEREQLGPVRSRFVRARNVLLSTAMYQASRRWPERVATRLREGVARQLPPDVPVEPHFLPRYRPWDQRLCVVPNGDLFQAMRAGDVSVVTGTIDRFTEKGLRMHDGTEVEADIVVTATGLTMVAFGEMTLTVDGRVVRPESLQVYKGMMFDGLPNLAWCLGYTNSSWTLRADLASRYVCRLLNYMTRHHIDMVTPRRDPADSGSDVPLLDLTSGYVRRAAAQMPRQGARWPWRHRNNYLTDLPRMRVGRIDDGAMTFARTGGDA
ncbi:flavin-containing monooxygenase [Mangrovihabitans endophyticus]|uniref:Monooxygenase flavin-binding family protein n=1 Tax=Mangrovihabitans endophyticus TaxID=1751298 RepID=A0A8J3BZT9_9ACTN|nr:NAD(P)/FAD-dependent oxidoreductase [Mangrovihabitans endophyticus]GGK97714.1 monooxygenase flavin-binding family protein [Mangrovihabitans endophyticus]